MKKIKYIITELVCYNLCGIHFYNNYERFMKTKYKKLGWYANDGVIDQEAYEKGMSDCIKYKSIPHGTNPYEKNTVEWLSYNKGWNNV